MRNWMTIGLIAALSSGCIVYDEELVWEDEPTTEDPDRPDREPLGDTGEDELAADLWLDPPQGARGDVVIVSLLSEGPMPEIAELQFYGPSDIAIVATQPRQGEIILTLDLSPAGDPGDNHLLVDLSSGDSVFIEDAFTVVP